MTTAARRTSAHQLAAEIVSQLDDLSISFPEAELQARRVLNLSIPLAESVHRGLVASVTADGRDALTEAHRDLGAIRDLLTAEAYARMVESGNWGHMWDLANPPAGVAYI